MIALIGSVTAIQMRSIRHEYAILIGGATAVLMLIEGIVRFTGLQNAFSAICSEYSIPADMLTTVVKILGIAYLTDFGVNIAKDAGQSAIAGALETGGKILIVSCALPALIVLLETGASLIRGAAP